jgi:NUDIX domain
MSWARENVQGSIDMEHVDILLPPRFEPSGLVKPVLEAIRDKDWLGVMNLWIVRPGPALIYQERPPGGWEPGKLDGSVGGYYRAGEYGLDGLREAEEELGWKYSPEQITFIGRRLSVGVDSSGRERRVVVTVFMVFDDQPLSRFKLDAVEVPAIFEVPIQDVVNCFKDRQNKFIARGLSSSGEKVEKEVTFDSFSYTFDDYHLKIAESAKAFLRGDAAALW